MDRATSHSNPSAQRPVRTARCQRCRNVLCTACRLRSSLDCRRPVSQRTTGAHNSRCPLLLCWLLSAATPPQAIYMAAGDRTRRRLRTAASPLLGCSPCSSSRHSAAVLLLLLSSFKMSTLRHRHAPTRDLLTSQRTHQMYLPLLPRRSAQRSAAACCTTPCSPVVHKAFA